MLSVSLEKFSRHSVLTLLALAHLLAPTSLNAGTVAPVPTAVTLNPPVLTIGDVPTFQWGTTDYERFNVKVFQGPTLIWNRGISAQSGSSVIYYGPAMGAGAYTVTLDLYDACNVLQNSVSQGFTVS